MVNKLGIGIRLLSCLLPLLLVGCGGDAPPEDLRQYVENFKQSSKVSAKKSQDPQLKPLLPVIYKAEPLRAPFEKEALKEVGKKVAATPLQAYPISVIKLLGTITEGSETYAYVVTPDQMTYRVNEGDRIGDRQGVVTSIQPGQVNVMEQDADVEKGSSHMQRLVTLQLKEAQ